MSTLPGLASKGEKGKSKYQSLDINSLYKVSLGESTEKQQQKSILSHKHGMQLLGKVPSARRPPANLPSLKSEHSGSDAAVSLVPSNGSGWGKQESASSSTSTTTTTNVSSAGAANATNTTSTHQANIALPVSTNPALQQQQQQQQHQQGAQQQIQQQQQQQQQSMPVSVVAGGVKQPHHQQQQQQQQHQQHGANPATGDKSWSSVMSGGEPSAHPPSYQSLMFEHEFPSLSAGDGGAPRSGTADTQYGPGPSLRPQTEGSWQLGGGAATRTDGIAASNVAGGPQRNGSAPHGAPPSHMGQGGPPLPQYRGFVPTFMYKGGNVAGNPALGQQQQQQPPFQNIAPGVATPLSIIVTSPQPQQQQQSNTSNANNTTANNNSTNQSTIRRQPQQQRNNQQHHETESSLHRPIIKEEELSGMDNLTSDMGWAMHDDIDYNQKLAFSDDEAENKSRGTSMPKDMQKSDYHHHLHNQQQHVPQDYHQQDYHHHQQPEHKPWSRQQQQQSSMHSEEDDMNAKRRRQQQEVASARERARLRKEEEEKKFYQAKQNKYKDMDEKMQQGKPPAKDDLVNAPAPASILLPEWERPKESEQEQQPPQQQQQHQQQQQPLPTKNDFRQLTQIEGRATYTRKDQRGGGGSSSEKDPANFKRQYQHNLPPRFQKRQQEQMNNGQQQGSLSSSGGNGGGGFAFESNRWGGGGGGMNKTSPANRKNHRNDNESEKDDDYNKYNYGRHRPYGGSGGGNNQQQNNSEPSGRKSSGDDYEYGNNRKDDNNLNRQHSNDDWQERRMERYGSSDRPQRPDSRDSRASRESRHSEPREYNSWAETHFEEDAKRHQQQHQQIKEHKMQVPGPITKDKLEADDLRNEKQRNLTQLKRGAISDMDNKNKSLEKTPEKEDDPWSAARKGDMGPRAWADAISPSTVAPENAKFMEMIDKKLEEKLMSAADGEDKRDDKSKNANLTGRGRSDSQNSRSGNANGGGNVYNRNMWSKKGGAVPPPRGGGVSRSNISRSSIKTGGDWHASESEGSADDATLQHHNEDQQSQVSPKLIKKGDNKDERNKDVKNDKANAPSNCITEKKPVGAGVGYVPRGEPSRHGRGGGGGSSSFRGGRGGCKRMDGYGLPPVKSPFPHEEQQQLVKKMDSDEMMTMDDKKKLLDMNKRKDTLNKKKTGRDGGDVSDNSDDVKDKNRKPKQQQRQQQPTLSTAMPGSVSQRGRGGNANSATAPSPRMSTNDKRQFSQSQLSNASLPPRMKDDKGKDLVNAMTEMNLSEEVKPESEQLQQPGDDGFQEVKSKKNLEKRPKSTEMKQQPMAKSQIEQKDSKVMMPTAMKPKPVHNLSQQQIANIPSLMATPVNPPPNMPQPQSNKGPFERPRQNKLPPRLVKQRENNRLHKAQMQQQGLNVNEINDMNKMAQNMQQHYGMKDGGGNNTACNLGMVSAWEKPLVGQLRDANANPDVLHALDINQKDPNCKQSADGGDKVLDGSNPLKTIIFENTNYKSAPGCRNRNNDKRGSGSKPSSLEDNNGGMEMNFGNKQIGELLNNKTNDKSDINMQLAFDADKAADIKLDFFENEISHLTEDKGSNKNMSLPRTMHTITSSNNTISPSTADDLNIKIQSVKKVWEMPTVIEVQQQQQQHQQQDETYSSSFGSDPNGMDQGFANKSGDGNDDNHEGYSPSANSASSNSNTTNVCKVKPTQQVAGSGGQSTVINTVSSGGSVGGAGSGGGGGSGGGSSVGGGGSGGGSGHQQHSTMVGPNLIGHPLSPPPQMPTVISALAPQPQQYTTNQHLGYQTAGLGGNTQYGIPAIPSPPTVLYNSSQQMPQSGLYGTFQLDQSQVLNSQGRSQYSQYSYGLGQTASSPYSAQSMYLQTQPHGPPNPQGPQDIYNNYRLPATGPFGQNQQLNNPTTVLISSTSNSLMSATVKPSGQQISAIGTKAGGVGQAYQQQSQQGQQLYMTYDPAIQANYLQNTGVMQRGPPPPPQNSVVAGLQPSSSYYSGSTVLCAGGQTAGYFQQPPPGNSSQMAPPPPPQHQHQAGYGLQGNVFGTHSQSHTGNAGMQNFNSPFLSGPMMAAMNAQQFRSAVAAASNMPPGAAVAASYMKSSSQQMDQQQGGRSQQLRSPGTQQEVLSSVFNTASQIPSPKSRQSCKQPQPQPSPTAPNKSGYLYQNVTNPTSGQSRYPAPIQRPNSNYGISSMQNNGQKHGGRPNNSGNRSASRQYYSSQGVGLNNQVDKSEDSKLVEGGANKLGAANQQPGGGASDKIDVGKDVENSAKD